jgi:hypothetical protein
MKNRIPMLMAGAVIAAALTAGVASASASPASHGVCVKHGQPGSVLGNTMLYDWNNSKCPAGTYGPVAISSLVAPAAPVPVARDFGTATNVITGGGFVANSTEVGTVSLDAGTYTISVNAKATPTGGAEAVFPQFFLYNQAKNSNFTGDLFNVGSGALATGSSTLDSYFSGSTVIKLDAATVLHVYAFGYSPDKSAGSFTLDDLNFTAVPIG